jgi:CRP-like cAMP-binding protein
LVTWNKRNSFLMNDKTDVITRLFNAMDAYYLLQEDTKAAITSIVNIKKVAVKEIYLHEGTRPRYMSFVCSGLFSYYTSAKNGDQIIKIFFAENSFMASTPALIDRKPSLFAIQALEDAEIIEMDFYAFRELTRRHMDLAQFWLSYLERQWVVGKEANEINLKYLTAKERYELFKEQHPGLLDRIRLKDMASYLGVTPTQMSRIRGTQHM